jgi:transcriptional regulator with XRE-family HTH domain
MTTAFLPRPRPVDQASTASSIAEVIRAARARAGLTQENLAELAGVSTRTVRNLETRRIVAPRLSSLRALVDVLGIDAAIAAELYVLATWSATLYPGHPQVG